MERLACENDDGKILHVFASCDYIMLVKQHGLLCTNTARFLGLTTLLYLLPITSLIPVRICSEAFSQR